MAPKTDHKERPDTELITLLIESDHTAYSEIYSRYHYLLINFAYKKLSDEEMAKDVVQETFIRLWEKRTNLPHITNLPAYLITITKRIILDLFDHEKVKTNYASSLAKYSLDNHIANTDHRIREKQLAAYIISQINTLPKKMRESFQLSHIEQLTNKEIAEMLNTSDNNVSQHISNALKILKAKLTSIH